MLDDNEMVEADNGYKGEPSKIRTRDDYKNKKERYEKDKIRARHETVNKHIKQFNALSTRFRHERSLHILFFKSALTLTQLSIDSGEILFQCDSTFDKEQGQYGIEDWDSWE